MNWIGGGKTLAGAILIGVAAGLKAFGLVEIGDIVMQVGAALGVIGIGHKVERIAKNG